MGTIASLLTGLMRKHTGEQFIIYSNSRVKLELTHIRLLLSLDCVQPLCKRNAILITGPMSKEQKFHRTHLFLKHEPASHHATAYHPVPGRILGFQKASLQQLCAFLAGDHQKTGTVWWYQYGPEGQKRPCYVLVQCVPRDPTEKTKESHGYHAALEPPGTAAKTFKCFKLHHGAHREVGPWRGR